MGAANSRAPAVNVLDRVVAQSQSFPWSINHGTLSNGNKCSIFVHKKSGPGSEALCLQFIKNLKLCRHPYILRYIESQEDTDAIYLVTEPVVPLGTLLRDLGELDIALGVHTLASALKFLHENVQMCHNNIKVSSIFVATSDNLWRLGGVEYVNKPDCIDSALIGQIIRSATPDHPASPEDIDGTYRSTKINCRDSWLLGHLISLLMKRFNGKADGELMKFKQNIKKLYCSADPRKRPSMEMLLSCPYFKAYPQHALINSVDFLESITIKDNEEKKSYFRKASSDLFHVSSDLFQKYLIRLMFSDLIFADENAREYLLPRLLSVKTKRESRGFYKSESYSKIMAPVLRDLYKRRAKHTRLVLLRLSRWYAPFLPSHFVKDYLLPEILLGLNDNDDAIVMATFNALAVLTSFLGSKTVVGSSLQKSHFYDSFPRNADPKSLEQSEHINEDIIESSFTQSMEGKILNDSDFESGKDCEMFHGSRQDMLKEEREKRANEFKKRREAKKKKENELKQVKLIEVATSQPDTSNAEIIDQSTALTSDSVLKKECFTHQQQLLIHEQQGFSMEYKGTMSDAAMWDSECNLDLGSEEECNKSLLEIVNEKVPNGEQDNEFTVAQFCCEDENENVPIHEKTQVLSDTENVAEIYVQMDKSGPSFREAQDSTVTSRENEGFSQWENGGWSDFDNQFETDAGIELATVNEDISEEHNMPDHGMSHVPIEQVPSNVSDVMNLERAVMPETDFFADMQPTYSAPKLL